MWNQESRAPLASAPQHVLPRAISIQCSAFARCDWAHPQQAKHRATVTAHLLRAFSQLTVCAYFAYLRLSLLLLVQSFKPAYAKSEPIELTPAHIALVRANLDLVASDQNASFQSQQQYDMPFIHFSMTFYNKLFTIIP
eukprot:7985-Heterococcus_DN1.PRE.2